MDKNLKSLTREAPSLEPDPQDAAAYVADMSGSLATLARRNGLQVLSYILDMAQEEAESHARSSAPHRVRQ